MDEMQRHIEELLFSDNPKYYGAESIEARSWGMRIG